MKALGIPARLIIAGMLITGLFTGGCGKVNPKNFAEGIRVMTGRGGTVAERDTLKQIAPIAQDLAGYQPKPVWETLLRADQTDFLELVGADLVLIGEIQLSSALADPSFGDIALYNTKTGHKLWQCSRPDLKGGSYGLLATHPVFLIQGIDPKTAIYLGINPTTGQLRWKQEIPQPQVGLLSRGQDKLFLLSEDSGGYALSAVRTADGSIAWRQPLKKTAKGGFDAFSVWVDDDGLIVAAGGVYRLSKENGSILWSANPPEPGAKLSLTATPDLTLVWGQKTVSAHDLRTGTLRWGPLSLGENLVNVTAPPSVRNMAFVVNRKTSGASKRIVSYLSKIIALDLRTGNTVWTFDPKAAVLSNILSHAGGIYFVGGTAFLGGKALVRLNTATGRKEAETAFPMGMRVSSDLPDLLVGRPQAVVAVKEKAGVAAFSTKTGEVLWHQKINLYGSAHFWYSVIRDSLSKVDASRGAALQAMERDEKWWSAWTNNLNPTASRGDASERLFQSLLSLSAAVERGLKRAAIEGLVERLQLSLHNNQRLHLRSIQGDYYVRPFANQGIGVTLVDLETGKRADFEFSAPNKGMSHMTMRLPCFALDPSTKRLVTTGIGLNPARWEPYVKFKWAMPYPSVMGYDLNAVVFRSAVWDDRDLPSAAGNGKLDKVKDLIAGGAWVDSRDTFGDTGLLRASYKGHLELVKFFLIQGADVNRRNEDSYLKTAIQAAANNGHTAVVKALLEAGADPRGALEVATKQNRRDVVEILQKSGGRP
ncbi:MAG: PQQ-binding-like beta-propeller repeat protein [Pseudomonadota bacterium]